MHLSITFLCALQCLGVSLLWLSPYWFYFLYVFRHTLHGSAPLQSDSAVCRITGVKHSHPPSWSTNRTMNHESKTTKDKTTNHRNATANLPADPKKKCITINYSRLKKLNSYWKTMYLKINCHIFLFFFLKLSAKACLRTPPPQKAGHLPKG